MARECRRRERKEGEFVQGRIEEVQEGCERTCYGKVGAESIKKDERAGYCGKERGGSRRSWKRHGEEVFNFWHIREHSLREFRQTRTMEYFLSVSRFDQDT